MSRTIRKFEASKELVKQIKEDSKNRKNGLNTKKGFHNPFRIAKDLDLAFDVETESE